jgi:hypothetical protein
MTAKKYGVSDYNIIANNIYERLCDLDKSDRNSGIDPKWHDLIPLIKKVNAYSDKMDVWRLAMHLLKDRKKLIERDTLTFKVKLTRKGRDSCNKRLKFSKKDEIDTNLTP